MITSTHRPIPTGWKPTLAKWPQSRKWAYLILSLLLVKTLWGIWEAKDFTGGDTMSYYDGMARSWHEKFLITPGWSPLYQIYFGSFLWIDSDPFFAAIAHRVGILIGVTFLLYEVMRNLVAPWIALLIAAWWIVLPINHNSLYEVHLFSMLLPLAAIWVVGRWDSPGARGIALATMAVSVFLLRPEFIVATAFLGIYCIWVDLVENKVSSRRRLLTLAAAYGLPLLLAGGIVGGGLTRSTVPLDRLGEFLQSKRKLNVNQLFAYGYHQRNPDWKGSPWTDCDKLMVEIFGSDDLGIVEAFLANPGAMTTHAAWNLANLGNGSSLGLFSARLGRNIDYGATRNDPIRVIVCGALFIALIAAGINSVRRDTRGIWRPWLRDRRGTIAGLICFALSSLFVLCLAPPRPAFIPGWILLAMASAGISLHIVVHSNKSWPQMSWLATPLTLIPLFFAPLYWSSAHPSQPIRAQIKILETRRGDLINGKLLPIAVSIDPEAIRAYLNLERSLVSRFYCARALGNSLPPGQTLDNELKEKGIRLVLIVDIIQNEPAIAKFEELSAENGWEKVVPETTHHHAIHIYSR